MRRLRCVQLWKEPVDLGRLLAPVIALDVVLVVAAACVILGVRLETLKPAIGTDERGVG